MKRRYSSNTALDFGMYKGYDLGLVYVFDPSYIEWCINNIDEFCITDLEELLQISVLNKNVDWQVRLIGDPSFIPYIDIFSNFKELIENLDLGEEKYSFSEEALRKNNERKVLGSSALHGNNKSVRLVKPENFEEDDSDGDFYEGDAYYDDQNTSGQNNGLCDFADNCSSCPNASNCF